MPVAILSSTYADIALLVLRLVLGVIVFIHGWKKIRNLAATKKTFANLLVPVPLLATIFACFVEFFGAFFLIAGLSTSWVALGIIIDMFAAMLFVEFKKGFLGGWELNLALLTLAFALLLMGPGALTIFAYLSNN